MVLHFQYEDHHKQLVHKHTFQFFLSFGTNFSFLFVKLFVKKISLSLLEIYLNMICESNWLTRNFANWNWLHFMQVLFSNFFVFFSIFEFGFSIASSNSSYLKPNWPSSVLPSSHNPSVGGASIISFKT